MFQTLFVEKIKIYFMFDNAFLIVPLTRYCAKYGTATQAIDYNVIWRMHFACWITKVTDTHSEYVIVIAVPLQEWLHEGTSLLRYIFDICLVNFVLLKRQKRKVVFSFTAQYFENISV
jgi:hypothetical protein